MPSKWANLHSTTDASQLPVENLVVFGSPMRCSSLSSRQPRRGQALLLAVLIMIFAALLSASFIALVSVNLNQTARQTDKNRAVVSAKAGLDYVTRQLAYSGDGDRWKPELPPVAQYGIYYTALDRAQGWAGDYAKFPDPRNATGQNAGPQFLAKVERIPTTILASNPEFDKAGAIKISVIGLSPEDPSAYSRTTAYFGGYRNAPLARSMRVVGNWDFSQNRVISAQANSASPADDGTAGTLTFNNASSDFTRLATPFVITISNPRSTGPNSAARSAVVSAVPNATTFTLATPLLPAKKAVAGDRIELAANIGAPTGIDYNNNGTLTKFDSVPANDIRVRLSDGITARASTNEVDSARINGGLVWSGDFLATKLRAVNQSFGASTATFGPANADLAAPGGVFASGVIAFDETPTSPKITVASANSMAPFTDTLKPSQTTGIFATGVPNYQLISDGWNRRTGAPNTDGTRNVTEFSPPVIDSAEGVERYRNLTRFSKPINPALPSSSLYGYGQGIYLDNAEDVEKIYDGTRLRAMTQTELIRMWQSPLLASAQNDRFSRIAGTTTPLTIAPAALANVATASLEEKHLHGWVGPDEFRARGALIELDFSSPAAPRIIITRDSRSDSGNINDTYGAAASKVWKDPQGNPLPGVYRREFAWPANGVIHAEGNVRVRGGVFNPDVAPNNAVDPGRSLTIVSMGNIYIEGDLNAGGALARRKILLLARKNVVCNPTAVIRRVDEQTRVETVATGTTLSVYDGSAFKRGDAIIVGNAGTTDYARITAISANFKTLTLDKAIVATAGVLNAPVRTLGDRDDPFNGTDPFASKIYNANRSLLENTTQAFQRRFDVNAATPSSRLTLRHSALEQQAMTLTTVGPTLPSVPPIVDVTSARLANKLVDAPISANIPPAAFITPAQRRVSMAYQNTTDTEEDEDLFALTPTTIGALSAELTAKYTVLPDTPLNHWQYVPTVSNPLLYNALPYFALTSYGNRKGLLPLPIDGGNFPPNTPPSGGPDYDLFGGWRRDVKPAAVPILLGTSVDINFNGASTNILRYTGEAATSAVKNFGFAPGATDNEDVLTADRTFYTSAATDLLPALYNGYTLQSFVLAPQVGNTNSISMGLNPAFTALNVAANTMPSYRLSSLKLENEDVFDATGTFSRIQPGHTFDIRAYVYAQQGSWFIIPGGNFDRQTLQNIKPITAPITFGSVTVNSGYYLDINNNNAPDYDSAPVATRKPSVEFAVYNNGTVDIAVPDLNRDGIGTADEQFEFLNARFSRYNYQINFRGAIAENQTVLVNDAGTTAQGAVASWMDRWATTSLVAGATVPTNDRIKYIFDPTIVLDGLQKDNLATTTVDETDIGFRLPYSPEVFNVS